MEKNNVLNSKSLKIILLSTAGLIILIFVFSIGVFVGTKKAEFSFKWADQYHRNFGGPQGGFLGNIMGQEFTESNGVFGQIIKINGQTLTIKSTDNIEKSILIGNTTTIVLQKKNIKLSDLKINDSVVVIGDPTDNGQIQAELIRVMPYAIPPSSANSAQNIPPAGNTNPPQ